MGEYHSELQCEVCKETFGYSFDDPAEPAEATCPYCHTHYPELYA